MIWVWVTFVVATAAAAVVAAQKACLIAPCSIPSPVISRHIISLPCLLESSVAAPEPLPLGQRLLAVSPGGFGLGEICRGFRHETAGASVAARAFAVLQEQLSL